LRSSTLLNPSLRRSFILFNTSLERLSKSSILFPKLVPKLW
jgi:hypothetical protein